MTECTACVAAESNPRGDEFAVGCRSCNARALAATGAHLESQAAGTFTQQYRDALDIIFGATWNDGHELVKRWAYRIQQHHRGRA